MSLPASRKRHDDRPFPKVWDRKDGGIEYHCPECGRLLIIANHRLESGTWIQVMCKRCGKERRFKAGED